MKKMVKVTILGQILMLKGDRTSRSPGEEAYDRRKEGYYHLHKIFVIFLVVRVVLSFTCLNVSSHVFSLVCSRAATCVRVEIFRPHELIPDSLIPHRLPKSLSSFMVFTQNTRDE